jgi:uncharacterized delta-60 repeat protein
MRRDLDSILAGAIVLASFGLAASTEAQIDGAWDLDFSSTGYRTIPLQGADATNSSKVILAQPDGRILVFGLDYVHNILHGQRLFADGAIDPTFDFADDVSGSQVFPVAGTLLDDGRIFIAGQRGSFADGTLVAWMITPNGTIDVNFGDAGMVEHDLPFEGDNIRVVARGPGDTLLVGSFGKHVTGFGSWTAMGITRLESDGDLDHTWNVSGTVVRNWRTNPDANDVSYLRALALESDGGVLIAGNLLNPSLGTDHAVVGRLTPTGAFDSGFGTSGRTFFRWTSDAYDTLGSQARAIARLADGGILAAGGYQNEASGYVQFGTARFTAIGGTDTNYGSGGQTLNTFGLAGNSLISAFAIDAAERAIVAGSYGSGPGAVYAVTRLVPDGSICPRFAGGSGSGLYILPPGGTTTGAQAIALHSDGGILVAGDMGVDDGSGGTTSAMVVQRLEGGLPLRDGFESASAWFWDSP